MKGDKKSRRDKGEGSIYERKDRGKWVAQLRKPNGKRETIYADTKGEARAKLDTLRRQVAAGMHTTTDSEKKTKVFAQEWLEDKRHDIKDGTSLIYEAILKHHLGSIGDVALKDVTPAMLQRHYSKLRQTLAPSYIRNIHNCLHQVFEHAVELDILPKNPAKTYIAPKVPKREYITLDREQVATLLSVARDDDLEAAFLLAFAAGLRSAEVRGLCWQDILWQQSQIIIRQQLTYHRRVLALASPKSEDSAATLDVPGYVLDRLVVRRERQDADRDEMGTAWADKWNLVFTTQTGLPVLNTTLLRRFYRVLKRAGLPQIRLHDLRHTYATLLLEEGCPLPLVSALLRHSSVAVTAQWYAHVTKRMHEQSRDKVASFLPQNLFLMQSNQQSTPQSGDDHTDGSVG